jgi:T5SS/PEP-CTERM-associated repeat protein
MFRFRRQGLERIFMQLLGLAIAIVVTSAAPAFAAITVSGEVSPDPLDPNTSVDIGINGIGTVRIDGGTEFESNSVELGLNQNGFGTATVTGAGTKWTFNDGVVGRGGLGRLEILDGALAEVTCCSGLYLGDFNNGHGTVVVSGSGSVLQISNPLRVGDGGSGLLQIESGAIVNVPDDSTFVGVRGRIELSGGTLRTEQLGNGGLIRGSGRIEASSTFEWQNAGRIEANTGDELTITGGVSNDFFNAGEVTANGGILEFLRPFLNSSQGDQAGSVTLRDGEIRFGATGLDNGEPEFINEAFVSAIEGTNHIYGEVVNQDGGNISAVNESLLMFHHNVTSAFDSVISVFAGSTAIFLENLSLNGGTLLADVTGADGFGHAEVVGDVILNGVLQVNLSNGFTPQAGDSFTLLTAAGGINQQSLELDVQPLPGGLDWQLQIGAHQVVLSVVGPSVPGDYNGNGVVDAADYTVWRDLLGRDGIGLAADGTGPGGVPDGFVDQLDYELWVDHFGETLGAASLAPGDSTGTNLAVPEPGASGLALAGVAAITGWFGRRRWLSHGSDVCGAR